MKTVAQHWEQAAKVMLPQGCHPTQAQEVRRAFYMGFFNALCAMSDAAGESGESDDIGATMIQNMFEECMAFSKLVEAGKA